MKKFFLLTLLLLGASLRAQEPDYSPWTRILQTRYHRGEGMDYEALANKDWAAMKNLVHAMAQVETSRLDRNQQLAYYLNLYNISVVNLLMENRKIASIRDLSTDPIIRFNIFRKNLVQMKSGTISLKRLEDEFIREGFKDPRVHFSLNCGARSCPPLFREAFVGEKVHDQLDEQVRGYMRHLEVGARFDLNGDTLVITLTKIMDGRSWFGSDFDQWAGGRIAFLRKYVTPDRLKLMDAHAGHIKLRFDDYDWGINRWSRSEPSPTR